MFNPSRLLKCRLTMSRIKQVLHEREIEYLEQVDDNFSRARTIKIARRRRLRSLKQTLKNPPKVYAKFDISRLRPNKRAQFPSVKARIVKREENYDESAEETTEEVQ